MTQMLAQKVNLKTAQVMEIVLLDHGLVMAGVMVKINHTAMT